MRIELVPASPPPLPQQQHCCCHSHSVRDEQSNSQLLHLPLFPPHVCLLTFFFPFAFCFKHGRVNLLILQAASLSIYLSSCFFSPSHSLPLSQAGLCCQALPEQWGCQEWWMTINLLLSSTTLLGDLQARWLPGMKTNLSFSFFPPFLHPCLPRSFYLTPSISTSPPLPKKAFIMERCVQNNTEICVWTEGSNCSSCRLLWMCQRGIASSEWYAWSLTAYLAHLHLLHCFQLLHRLATHEHPSMFFWLVVIIESKKGAGLIAVSK